MIVCVKNNHIFHIFSFLKKHWMTSEKCEHPSWQRSFNVDLNKQADTLNENDKSISLTNLYNKFS